MLCFLWLQLHCLSHDLYDSLQMCTLHPVNDYTSVCSPKILRSRLLLKIVKGFSHSHSVYYYTLVRTSMHQQAIFLVFHDIA